jgi:MFS transporter, DHA1 family, tetracycline resistance protein
MKKKAVKRNLLGLFLVIFLDLLGVGIIIPILAPLMLDPVGVLAPIAWDETTRTLVLGALIGIYPIMQFFGAPILGALSDRFGRKNLLTTSLLGTLIGYLVTGYGIYSGQLWMVFVGRGLDGFTGGNVAVANSAIADMSSEEDRASNFGLVGAAFGLGFIFGPFLGGVLSNPEIHPFFSAHLPFLLTAGLSLVNLILIGSVFKETLKESIFTKISPFTGFRNLRKAMKMSEMHSIFQVIFLHQLGFAFFTQFFPVFLVLKFSFTETDIGLLFGYTGLWIAFGQGVLTRIVAKHAGPSKALKYSILLLSLGIFLHIFPANSWYFLLLAPIVAMAEGITFPNTTAVASNLTPDNKQGEIMGVVSSLRALGMAVPPLIAGVLVTVNQNFAIIAAAVITLLAWVSFMYGFRESKA